MDKYVAKLVEDFPSIHEALDSIHTPNILRACSPYNQEVNTEESEIKFFLTHKEGMGPD